MKVYALLLAVLLAILPLSACAGETNGYQIVSIDADGVMTVSDAAGETYTFEPVDASTPLPVIPHRNEAVSVLSYGAVGDGVADDTQAIRAALDAVSAGGVLWFPAGTYRITETIRVANDNLIIEGDGNATTLTCGLTESGAALLEFDGADSIVLRNFCLRSAMTGVDTMNLTGIRVGACNDLTIADVDISNYNDGIYVGAKGENFPTHIAISDCEITKNGYAAISLGQVRDVKISACELSDNGYAGVCADGNGQPLCVIVYDNQICGNGTVGVGMTAGEDVDVLRNTFKANGIGAVSILGETVENVIVSDNTITEFDADADLVKREVISIGTLAKGSKLHSSFVISGNTVRCDDAAGVTPYVLTANGSTSAIVTDNDLDAPSVDTALEIRDNGTGGDNRMDLSVTGNQFRVGTSVGGGVVLCAARTVHIDRNLLRFEDCGGASIIDADPDTEILNCAYNTVSAASGTAADKKFCVTANSSDLWSVRDNVWNGK